MDAAWIQGAALGAAGVCAGVLGGLLGIGAGSLMVPVLIFVYLARNVPTSEAGLLAVATSLLAIVVLSTRAFVSHRRHGAGSWRAVAAMGPGGILGALAGAELALRTGGATLIDLFAGLEILLGIKFLRGKSSIAHEAKPAGIPLPHWLAVGAVAGLTSSFFGVGGGIVAVPLQVALLRVPMHTAIANSSGLIVLNALVGVGRYFLSDATTVVATAVGWVDIPAGLWLSGGALLGAPLGVRLAHALPAATLRRVFGAFLVLIGLVLWLTT